MNQFKGLKVLIYTTFLLIAIGTSHADISMRKCLVLPVTDGVGGAIGFKVFQRLELYLKESDWCYYVHNSDILNILRNYKTNLHTHLRNPEVVKLIAQKVNAGSLIRIKIDNQVKGISVMVEVLGSNGKDVFYKESGYVKTNNSEDIVRMVKRWLELYAKTIPYEGQLLSVLGNQFIVDIGKRSRISIGNAVVVKRPKLKREHPLLKEIVEWESEIIGKGSVFSVSDNQASGVIKVYYSQKRPQKGDWVTVDRKARDHKVTDFNFPEVKENEFGKLGRITLSLGGGQGSISTFFKGTHYKIGGYNVGLYFNTVIWATRNWFGEVEIDRLFGSYNAKTATTDQKANTVTKGVYKAYGGYKFLPLGFFYGPQIDAYAGFARYSINADTKGTEGFGEWAIKGFLIGVRGDTPIHKKYRAYLRFEMIPTGSYSEDAILYGSSEDTARVFDLEFGASYMYSPLMSFHLGMNLVSAKATFTVDNNSEVHSRDYNLKLGASFTF